MVALLVALYLLAVVAANSLVAAFGPSVTIINAFVLIAFSLASRDALHDRWGNSGLRWKMSLLVLSGSALSALLNADAAPIALASAVAFAVSGALDTFIYAALPSNRLNRAAVSNAISGVADSVVFPLLAFGLPLLWGIVLGQIVAKAMGGLIWAWVFYGRGLRQT